MSAVLQLPMPWGGIRSAVRWKQDRDARVRAAAKPAAEAAERVEAPAAEPITSVAFYRRHTEKMLRRYLYASMQVGRAPSVLGEPVARGWASSRPVKTFEDAVIFVLDVERCLNELGSLDRQILYRVVIQEYTQSETASLLGMSSRSISTKFPVALDRLTEKLLETHLLVLPH